MAAVSNSLIGIYLKQFFYVADQVADFVNFYGFWKTADSFEEITWVPLSCNTSQTRTERFNEYGYGTLGITWIPGAYILCTIINYIGIRVSQIFKLVNHCWPQVFLVNVIHTYRIRRSIGLLVKKPICTAKPLVIWQLLHPLHSHPNSTFTREMRVLAITAMGFSAMFTFHLNNTRR